MTHDIAPLIIKFDGWPDTDRRLWSENMSVGGLFDAAGLFSHWSQGTQDYHRQNYGAWLSFLTRHYPHLLSLDPADRISEDAVRTLVDESVQRLRPRSIANLLLSLLIVMRGFGPSANWTWLAHAAHTMLMRSMPHQLKPPLPITAPEVFGWARSRLRVLEEKSELPSLRTAAHYRIALSIGFLIAVPVRARSFVAMTVKRHVEAAGDRFMLHFAAEDMKTKREMSFALPELLVPHFRRYLDVYRPVLLNGRDADALWIGERGCGLSQDSLTSGLALATYGAFGLSLRPHAFRHIAATSIADYAPEHVGIIRDILGHTSLRMAEQHYNRATAISSSRRMQSILRQLRKRKPQVRLLRSKAEERPT